MIRARSPHLAWLTFITVPTLLAQGAVAQDPKVDAPQGSTLIPVAREKAPAAELPKLPEHGENYETPRAGEGFWTRIFGHEVTVYPEDRRTVDGILRVDGVLSSIGVRLTTGFLLNMRLEAEVQYNFDVVRAGDLGGYAVTFHFSRNF